MSFKANRSLKVYSGSSSWSEPWYYGKARHKTKPMIRLQGDWLEELGFTPGTRMNVHCEEGKLTLTAVKEDEENVTA